MYRGRGGAGRSSAPRVPEDGASLSIRRLKRIADDGPPTVGTLPQKRRKNNSNGMPPTVGSVGGGSRGRGRGGSSNRGGPSTRGRGAPRGAAPRGRGGGSGRGRGGHSQSAQTGPTGANAEPQTDYYSTDANLYRDYADAGTGDSEGRAQETAIDVDGRGSPERRARSPPRRPSSPSRGQRSPTRGSRRSSPPRGRGRGRGRGSWDSGRPEITDSYRPERDRRSSHQSGTRHALPRRPDVSSPGASMALAHPSSPSRMPPPSTPAATGRSYVSLLSSSPAARFHLDSDMVFEPLSDVHSEHAEEVEHTPLNERRSKGKAREQSETRDGGYIYSPSSPLPQQLSDHGLHEVLSQAFSKDSPWSSALGLSNAPGPSRPTERRRESPEVEKSGRPAPPPLGQPENDKLAPKPFKLKPQNRNIRKNEPHRPAPVQSTTATAPTGRASSEQLKSNPSAPPPASTLVVPSGSAASRARPATTSPVAITAPLKRKATPETVIISSSPVAVKDELPTQQDIKPNIDSLSSDPAAGPSAPTPMLMEGVLALRRADLPADCYSGERIKRVPARAIVARNAKARVQSEGKIVLGTRWRDDGFCVDWQRPTPSPTPSREGSIEVVPPPPREEPEVIDLLDSSSESEDEEPLARRRKAKPALETTAVVSEPRSSTSPSEARDLRREMCDLSVSTSSPAVAGLPSTKRAVDSSTLPTDEAEGQSIAVGTSAATGSDVPEILTVELPELRDYWGTLPVLHPIASTVIPWPDDFREQRDRDAAPSYAKWRNVRLSQFRHYEGKTSVNEVTGTETESGLRVNWRQRTEEEIKHLISAAEADAVERKRQRRERRAARRAAERAELEASEARGARGEQRATHPSAADAKVERMSVEASDRAAGPSDARATWTAVQDVGPPQRLEEAEADELDEELKEDDEAAQESEAKDQKRKRKAQKTKKKKKKGAAKKEAEAKAAAQSAPAPSLPPPAGEPSRLPVTSAPKAQRSPKRSTPSPRQPPAPLSTVHSAPLPVQAVTSQQSIGSVPSPPLSPPPAAASSSAAAQKDAELARVRDEITAALGRLARWQKLKGELPGQGEIMDQQIEQCTTEVFRLQEELERIKKS